MAKLTKTNFKSFIKKNVEALQVKHKSQFDGMTDGLEYNKGAAFHPALKTDRNVDHSFGINGLWLVGGGRDYFNAYEDDNFVGIEVYNSCGNSIVAVAK